MDDDAGQTIKGIKSPILVDPRGLMLKIVVHQAGIQDREGALLVLDNRTGALVPFLQVIFADRGSQGPATADAIGQIGHGQLSIVKRSDPAKGVVVLPKRWIVERTLAWLSRCRRRVRNDEHRIETALAFVRLAMIRLMIRGHPQTMPAIIFQDRLLGRVVN